MTYYICDKPWEPEILGISDGLSQAMVDEKGFKDKTSYKTFMHSFGSPLRMADDQEAFEINFELECVRLKKHATITDFLWFSPMSYFLISSRLRTILSEFNLQDHKYFKAYVTNGSERFEYNFMYMRHFGFGTIDFPKCEFVIGNRYDGFKTIYFDSLDELRKSKDLPGKKRIALKGIDNSLDMFETKLLADPIISEKLKKRLEYEKITGIKFKPIEIEFQ